MNKYHVLVNGQNFLIDVEGKIARHGFFQNFFLEAESPEQAEQLAVDRVRHDEALRTLTRNAADDRPAIVVDEIREMDASENVESQQSGQVWYAEKKWWQFWK